MQESVPLVRVRFDIKSRGAGTVRIHPISSVQKEGGSLVAVTASTSGRMIGAAIGCQIAPGTRYVFATFAKAQLSQDANCVSPIP